MRCRTSISRCCCLGGRQSSKKRAQAKSVTTDPSSTETSSVDISTPSEMWSKNHESSGEALKETRIHAEPQHSLSKPHRACEPANCDEDDSLLDQGPASSIDCKDGVIPIPAQQRAPITPSEDAPDSTLVDALRYICSLGMQPDTEEEQLVRLQVITKAMEVVRGGDVGGVIAILCATLGPDGELRLPAAGPPSTSPLTPHVAT
mmetsp:Transcript_76189/g.204553  ORF Transcript_76189/g.204553 Transcript_76189/m.204553 type:complete len:204 (+) Transcript_76189:297-908(+)